jgi:AraC-like DNA-binding protein
VDRVDRLYVDARVPTRSPNWSPQVAGSLLLKDRPISEVSAALSFADKRAFTRAFKKWAGTTPARWRSEHATSVLLDRR